MAAPSDLLTVAQAAELLGLSVRQVQRLAATGVLPVFRPSPRVTLIRRGDLKKAAARPAVGNPNFGKRPSA